MVALPERNLTVDAIYAKYEERNLASARRTYLGGSRLGEECRRRLWYEFRWVGRPSFSGRILRLFDTGHREEQRIIHDLRAIGVTVHSVDPDTGDQFAVEACEGHVRGHFDGALLGLMEAPKTWHLFEAKTSSKKYFDQMLKEGCKKAKPEHWAQMQLYMGLGGLTRAAYFVQCKDDDRLYMERVKFSKAEFEALLRKARAIVYAESPPDRIGKDRSFWKCKFCDFADYCFGTMWPDVNCRTCASSTPVSEGRWECDRGLEMELGCAEHVFLPPMIHWAEPVDGDEGWVRYRADGYEFVNCAASAFPAQDVDHYSSRELRGGRE